MANGEWRGCVAELLSPFGRETALRGSDFQTADLNPRPY